MRRYVVLAIGLGLALIAASAALAENTQQLSVTFSTTKAPKQKRVGGTLNTITTTGLANPQPSDKIAPPTNSKVYFDNDIDFDSDGLPTCKASKIEGTITSAAKQICRRSIVGSGMAVTAIGGIPTAEVESVVTAFNGPVKNGRDTLILHNRADSIATTVVLTGVLHETSGPFGSYLDVPVPPLPLDSSVISFQLKTGKTYFVRGRKHLFVAARCADRDRTWNFKSKFTYEGNKPLTSYSTQKCTVKR